MVRSIIPTLGFLTSSLGRIPVARLLLILNGVSLSADGEACVEFGAHGEGEARGDGEAQALVTLRSRET
jgi:hypothetical protein